MGTLHHWPTGSKARSGRQPAIEFCYLIPKCCSCPCGFAPTCLGALMAGAVAGLNLGMYSQGVGAVPGFLLGWSLCYVVAFWRRPRPSVRAARVFVFGALEWVSPGSRPYSRWATTYGPARQMVPSGGWWWQPP